MEPPNNGKMQPVQSKGMPLCQNPLAKAMQKKPKKQTQSSETWADEKIQSVSQQIREQSLADHDKRRQDMQRQLVEAEAQLVVMKELLIKREEMLKETSEDTENQVLDEDGNLVSKDSETGEKKVLAEEDKKEPSKKITKKRIQEMKEKLRLMNAQTECYLADIENTMQYLGSLEEASERAGPMSKEMEELLSAADGEDDFINQVYNENRQPRIPTNKKSGAAQRQKSPVVERTVDSRASDEEEADSQDGDVDEEQKEEAQASNAEHMDDRKFFITDRDGDTVLDYEEVKDSCDETVNQE